jgi:magnesium chelatase family protein
VGGGGNPRPGEISLAHNGVLFLDELAEWSRHALETLRQPMESGRVVISRAARQSEFPARFQLVAAMNPCPCGWAGDPSGRCGCSAEVVARYRTRLSGPLLDRIDLQLAVPRLPPSELRPGGEPGESTATVRARVLAARERQLARAGVANAHLDQATTERDCVLAPADRRLLERAIDQLQLSARALHRIQRVARTLADLAGEDAIGTAHVAEAIGYRLLDRAPG